MVVWEIEDESSAPFVASLPTPNDTPYRTPSRNSKKSRRSVTPPGKSSSPPPEKGDRGSKRSSRDVSTDEGISILDPRRFTPTLHANLVSEILALRRDQEDKLKLIESLETSLHAAQEDHDALRSAHTTTAKENRSLKRQLALLEGGTSSALGELARERDEAVDATTETRKRLETAQRKVRSLEEEAERSHDLWTNEKNNWEDEKRKHERRVHVAEARLKAVLDEVAAFQAPNAHGNNAVQHAPETEMEEPSKETDAASVRTMSMTNSIRFSLLNGPALGKSNGHSLADELNFEGDEDYDTDNGGRESVLSHSAFGRNGIRESPVAKIHRRNQSNESLIRPGSAARGRLHFNQTVLERLESASIREDDEQQQPVRTVAYTDTGVQFSPPPSPKLPPRSSSRAEVDSPSPQQVRRERQHDVDIPPRQDWEVEANQRRKRIQLSRPLSIPSGGSKTAHGAAQTTEDPPSPPKTPKSPIEELLASPSNKVTHTVSSSTQTDLPPPPSFLPPPPPMVIPSISIYPPTSRPTTPREPRLPQLVKNFGCQVNLSSAPPSSSIGIQTEEIRVDRRLDKLPVYLRPSAISSRPVSPATIDATQEEGRNFTPVPGVLPPRNPRRLATRRSFTDPGSSPPARLSLADEERDAYPGNNDNGSLSGQKAPMRRPHRISSLFAGFEAGSSDEADDFAEGDLSDSEYRTALSAPRPRNNGSKPSKRISSGASSSLGPGVASTVKIGANKGTARIFSDSELPAMPSRSEDRDSTEGQAAKTRLNRISRAFERSGFSSGNRSGVMRKAALIQNGIASHQTRSRSPSLPEPREPPFPIPTRASSRKLPISASAPSDGQRSPTRGDSWHRRGVGRSHYRHNSIRKVRSAAAIPGKQRYRQGRSRSPPPPLTPVEIPDTPTLPPLPNSEAPGLSQNGKPGGNQYSRKHQTKLSTTTANTQDTGVASTGSASQATGVVDAIAQTMVGEWMFKYVRRRKSFSVGEATGKDDGGTDRHKRWVWLAPYERAILWSSKQPTSGTALMGKSGRKLTIQSVLDVKDDNPPPKGSTFVFNRSILILTPQRALKFTATSAERHYVWLTALSFLAHSTQDVPDIPAVPPPPKPVPDFGLPQMKAKRSGIRDSIRLAKNKTSSIRSGAVSAASSHGNDVPSIPSIPPSIAEYRPPPVEPISEQPVQVHTRESSRETAVAEGPYIPRFYDRANNVVLHGRKRSNTGGHVPPPLSFRGFSGPTGSSGFHASSNSNAASTGTTGSSDIYQLSHGSSNFTWGVGNSGYGSGRTSEASSRPAGAQGNFFDAIGTVRMEAFISPLAFSGNDGHPEDGHYDDVRRVARRRSKELRRRASRSRHRESYHSRGGTNTTRGTDEYFPGHRTAGEEEFYTREDPFKGF